MAPETGPRGAEIITGHDPEIHQPNTSNGVCPENGLRRLVNVFRNAYATVPCETITIDEALGRIKSGHYASQIAGVRRIFAEGDPKKYSAAKCGLEAFTFRGFLISETKNHSASTQDPATIDYDHVGENTAELFTQVCRVPYVLSAFLSPSGEGVKVVVRIPIVSHAAEYERIYLALLDDLASKIPAFAVNRDRGTKDVSRLCFVSHDPLLYSNPEATVFVPPAEPIPSSSEGTKRARAILVSQIKKVANAQIGARHDTRIRAGYTIGGIVASGQLPESAIDELVEVARSHSENPDQAERDIRDSAQEGAEEPLEPSIQASAGESPKNGIPYQRNKSEAIRETQANYELMLQHESAWRGKLAYNLFRQVVELDGRSITNVDRAGISGWASDHLKVSGGAIKIRDQAIAVVAARNSHDPLQDYVNHLPPGIKNHASATCYTPTAEPLTLMSTNGLPACL